MNILLLKLILTPALIGIISVAGRLWGPSVSGLLVGLPLTSGPIALFLALGQGMPFAAQFAVGALAGGISEALFCLVYSRMASRIPWALALLVASLAFGAATFALRLESLPPALPLYVGVAATLVIVLVLLPRTPAKGTVTSPPAWDIPLRMLIATAFVLALTTVATLLGPQLSGLLSPFPIYAAILAVFTQRLDGPAAAVRFLRSVTLGLFAFCTFFLVLALALVPFGIILAFLAAAAITLAMQGVSLVLLRRGRDANVVYGQEKTR